MYIAAWPASVATLRHKNQTSVYVHAGMGMCGGGHRRSNTGCAYCVPLRSCDKDLPFPIYNTAGAGGSEAGARAASTGVGASLSTVPTVAGAACASAGAVAVVAVVVAGAGADTTAGLCR